MSTLPLKFLVAVVVLFSIYQSSTADAETVSPASSPSNVPDGKDPTVIRKTCKRTSNYDRCVNSLEEDIRSYDATDSAGLVKIAIEHVLMNVNHLRTQANALKGRPGYDDMAIRALESCAKVFGESVDTLMQAIQAIDNKDYKGANTYTGEALDAAETCSQEFKESGRKMPFFRRNGMVKELTSIALDLIEHI